MFSPVNRWAIPIRNSQKHQRRGIRLYQTVGCAVRTALRLYVCVLLDIEPALQSGSYSARTDWPSIPCELFSGPRHVTRIDDPDSHGTAVICPSALAHEAYLVSPTVSHRLSVDRLHCGRGTCVFPRPPSFASSDQFHPLHLRYLLPVLS